MPVTDFGRWAARRGRPTLVLAMELEHPRLLPGVLVPDPERDPRKRSTRDWLVDLACFLVAVVGGFLVFAESADRMSDSLQFYDLVGGSVASLALWWRRRWPVGVALFILAFNTFSSSASIAGAIAIFTVAVHRRAAVAFALGAVSLAVTPILLAVQPDDPDAPDWFQLVFGVLATGAVIAWGMFVRSRRQLVLSLRDRAERAEAEQQLRVEQARQHERARIAREMHDVLAHRISLLSLHAGALEFHPDASPEEIARAAGVIRTSAHDALEDLRAVIGVLREGSDGAGPERPQPTLSDLPALIEESREAGMQVRFECELPEPGEVPVATGRSAYRIVQEGLTNARKHARGAAVEVTVAGMAGTGLTIEIRNRLPVGVAAATEIPGTGTGIVGLAERASLAGGRLEHGRTASGDYRLWVWLPWPP
jgi:signal transduction histidine kinase